MSTAARIPLAQATVIAEEVCAVLRSFCQRIEVAGSIRRRRETIGDVELVAIPKVVPTGLLGDELTVDPGFIDAVNKWPKVKGKPAGKYTQRWPPGGITLDLFMANTDNWGLIYAVRTGSADFSHQVLAVQWVKRGYKSVDGRLTRVRDGQVIPIREEADLFALLRIPYVEPWAREV
jgi:DNA polymerase/3'-5' exonuclease PolX